MNLNNSLLYICCKVIRGDGNNLDAGITVDLLNYLLPSIFSHLDVTLDNHLISQSNSCCPYQAVMELVLNYSMTPLPLNFSLAYFTKAPLENMKQALWMMVIVGSGEGQT